MNRRPNKPRRRVYPVTVKDLHTGEFQRRTSGTELRRAALIRAHDKHTAAQSKGKV